MNKQTNNDNNIYISTEKDRGLTEKTCKEEKKKETKFDGYERVCSSMWVWLVEKGKREHETAKQFVRRKCDNQKAENKKKIKEKKWRIAQRLAANKRIRHPKERNKQTIDVDDDEDDDNDNNE